jgi:DnaJ family protein C protein 9
MPSKAQTTSEELLDEPPTSINPYQVLDVEKDATPDKIKSAYRKAALQSHPGMNKCSPIRWLAFRETMYEAPA